MKEGDCRIVKNTAWAVETDNNGVLTISPFDIYRTRSRAREARKDLVELGVKGVVRKVQIQIVKGR